MMPQVWVLAVMLGGMYLALFALERFMPLRIAARPLWPRVLVNAVMTALALGAAAVTVRPAVWHMLELAPAHQIGLLAWFDLPAGIEFALAFVLFDWSFYWWHVANHRVPLLWRFHNVHHVDPDLDVTTAFRFHAVEVGYSTLFRVAQVVVIAPAVWMFIVYEFVFQLGTLLHHSNVALPLGVERMVNRVFVTPWMHGIHHSHVHRETDSNYASVFSWWDRLHRTLRLNVGQRAITIGVPGYATPRDNRLWRLLRMPFVRQRSYWQQPDGIAMQARPASLQAGSTAHMLD